MLSPCQIGGAMTENGMIDLGPNDACICGSGKKWKRCHDPRSGKAKPVSPRLAKDERIDEALFSLGLQIVDFFEEVLAAIKMHSGDFSRRNRTVGLSLLVLAC